MAIPLSFVLFLFSLIIYSLSLPLFVEGIDNAASPTSASGISEKIKRLSARYGLKALQSFDSLVSSSEDYQYQYRSLYINRNIESSTANEIIKFKFNKILDDEYIYSSNNAGNVQDILGFDSLPALKTTEYFISNVSVPKHELLLIFTTCNQINMSALSLSYLRSAIVGIADLIVIDDYSEDGTVDLLSKRGFHVISKAHPRGLTDSWNYGYKFAIKNGYKYIIIMNNDVLMPRGALEIFADHLRDNAVVLPMTTGKKRKLPFFSLWLLPLL